MKMFERLGPPRPLGTRGERVTRRVASIFGYILLLTLVVLTMPLLLIAGAIADVVKKSRAVYVRAALFFVCYFVIEILGTFYCMGIWVFSGIWAGAAPQRFYRWHFFLQRHWVRALTSSALRIFNMRVEVEGDADLARNNFILFVRHASVADTIMQPFVAYPQFVHLRIVLKRELLWDPCLEFSFNSLPNYFVERGAADSEHETQSIGNLMENLGPHEGIFIYPEGTRFSEEKRERILQKLEAAGDRKAYESAEQFRAVLPPRLGGSLALLERNTGADAIFCAHTGLEGAATFRDFHHGTLVGMTIRMKYWRVPFAEIPTTEEARIEWLLSQWRLIDEFVASHQEPMEEKRQVA